MEENMRCDDLFQAYIVGNNPVLASCAKAEYLVAGLTAKVIQVQYYGSEEPLDRKLYKVKDIHRVFFAYYRGYVIPTVEEYFTWVRDLYKHLVCYSKLLKIHSDGLHDFKSFGENVEELVQYLKDDGIGLKEIDEYKKFVNTKDIESAMDFIMNLCPTDAARKVHMKMNQDCAQMRVLRQLRNCVLDCMKAAEQMDQDFTLFTRGEPYKKCFENTGAKDLAINLVEGHPFLVVPESLLPTFKTVDSADVKKFSIKREGMHDRLVTKELEQELHRPVNIVLIFSDCCRKFFTDLLSVMDNFQKQQGWARALEYMSHRLEHSYLVQTIDPRASISEFNYALLDRLLSTSGPEPTIPMSDVGDSPAEIAEKKDDPKKIPEVVAKKKEKKDPKKDDNVFIALGIFAVIMVAFASG